MPLLIIDLPASVDPFVPVDRIMEYLQGAGISTAIAAINNGDGTVTLELENMSQAIDIETMVANFQGNLTAREQLEAQVIADAKTTIRAIRDKGPANWTAQDKVTLAIALNIPALKEAT